LQFRVKDCCVLRVWDGNGCNEFYIGLDEVYRINGREAWKGIWENDNTFYVNTLNLQYNYEIENRYIFDGDKLIYEISSPIWGLCERMEGVLE
jgi:hypothetical protein